jgi:malic enzyme
MQGVKEREARLRIWMLDSRGLLGEGRDKMSESKAQFAQSKGAMEDVGLSGGAELLNVVKAVGPTCLVGCAGKGGLFTKEVLQALASAQPAARERSGDAGNSVAAAETQNRGLHGAVPIVLALSNPTDNSECTFQDAWEATNGHVVFASGSPFPPVDTEGGKVFASQANNALVYPGVGAAAALQAVTEVPDSLFLAAAHALADETTAEEKAQGHVMPPVKRIRDAALAVTARVCVQSSLDGVATQRGTVPEVFRVASGAHRTEGATERKVRIEHLRDIINEWRF